MFSLLNKSLLFGAVLTQVALAAPHRYHRHSSSVKSATKTQTSSTAASATSVVISTATAAEPTATISTTSSLLTPTTSSSPAATATSPPVTTGNGTFWQPAAGTTWQIELSNTVQDTSLDVDVFDMDLFDNSAATITTIHSLGKKAICYFSAGTDEDWRSDAASFLPADLGSPLADWPGETYVDTNSANVRSIMAARIALAASKGCDGVDPDNVDLYDNDNGLGLTKADAIDYMNFLAETAHSAGLAIGLKNALDIIPDVLTNMEWAVNEQCAQYSECDSLTPFIDANKPVFHIEYPNGAGVGTLSASATSTACAVPSGFSTLLKDEDLDAWYQLC